MIVERRRHPRLQLDGVTATLIPCAEEPETYEDAQRALEKYLGAEARELARTEAYVCPECGFAAGVHDESCTRFAAVIGR